MLMSGRINFYERLTSTQTYSLQISKSKDAEKRVFYRASNREVAQFSSIVQMYIFLQICTGDEKELNCFFHI